MSSTEDSDNETNRIDYTPPRTPPDLREEAKLVLNNLLPPNSKDKYMKSYETFIDWKKRKGANKLSENVFIAYFSELAKTKKPSTLWAIYSMLKSTVSLKHNVNIKQYDSLTALLKRRSAGFKSTKSKIFTAANIEKFLNEAPDSKYLAAKVALVLGVNGACRSIELTNLTMEHIENHDNVMIVKLCDTKTKIDRMCVVRDDNLDIVRKYVALRPDNTVTNRFFLTYRDGKCTKQPIGRHKLALMPRHIATYLNLPDVESYTGHCFRRSSATLLVDSGANLTTLKRYGRRKSHEVVESYIEESLENHHEITDKITQNTNFKLSSSSSHPPKPRRPQPSTSCYVFQQLSPEPTSTSHQPLQQPNPQVSASKNTDEVYKPTRSHSHKASSFKDCKTEFCLSHELFRSETDSLDTVVSNDLSFDEDDTRVVATSSGQKRKRTESAVTEKQQPTSKEHKVQTEGERIASVSQKHEECEVYGRSIGHQMKNINDHQLAICQKIISEAIFFAKLNKLNEYSHIVSPPEPPNLQQSHFYSPSMPSSTYSPPPPHTGSSTARRHSRIQQQSPNVTSPSDEVENVVVTVIPEESTDDPLTLLLVKSEMLN